MSKRVLIVDDAVFMRTMIKSIFTKNGYKVVGEAENGVIAVGMYKELKPDLVTLDIDMPEMNGIECLEAILKEDPEAQIIMVSSTIETSTVIQAIDIGAKDFIVKPFQQARILQAVERVLKL